MDEENSIAQKIRILPIYLIVLFIFIFMFNSLAKYLIYPVPRVIVPSPPTEPFKEVEIKLAQNELCIGWYHEIDSKFPILLYFHGNAENLATLWQAGIFNELANLNVNYLSIDYPGYGKSNGKPSENSITKAAQNTLDWMVKKYPDSQIILGGWSLGAAVAIKLAADNLDKVDGLVALSAWSSIVEVAKRHYPHWMVKVFLKENYNSLVSVKQINVPTLLLHGERDFIIPVDHGRKLSQNFANKPLWHVIPGAGHNDLLAHPTVWQKIQEFVEYIVH